MTDTCETITFPRSTCLIGNEEAQTTFFDFSEFVVVVKCCCCNQESNLEVVGVTILGGDIVNQYELDMEYIRLVNEWYVANLCRKEFRSLRNIGIYVYNSTDFCKNIQFLQIFLLQVYSIGRSVPNIQVILRQRRNTSSGHRSLHFYPVVREVWALLVMIICVNVSQKIRSKTVKILLQIRRETCYWKNISL